MLAFFGTKLSDNQAETAEGYLICRNVPIARTGEQVYLARELGLNDGDPERAVTVRREEREVFDPAAMASFEGKDITDDHPPVAVTPENYALYSKGHVQNVRREGDRLVADLVIKDPALIGEVRGKVKREISCGYDCLYLRDGGGYKQTHIRGNHVAVVSSGRAGHEVAIRDSAETTAHPTAGTPVDTAAGQTADQTAREGRTISAEKANTGAGEAQKGALSMSATKALLEFFGLAAKEATAEELKTLTENTALVLDAEPAAKAPEAKPTEKKPEAKDEDIPKGDDLGSKLDKILTRLETLEKRINGHGGPNKDAAPEDAIDAEIKKLTGKDGDDPDEDGEEKQEAEILEETTSVPEEDACPKDACANKDAAVLLRALRPVVAGIQDMETRKSVADAILGAVRGQSAVGNIQRAALDSARKSARDSGKNSYQQTCEAQQSAYNARNPHSVRTKKEG